MAESEAKVKLLRILHYGSENAVYYPGCRLQEKYYGENKVKQLRALIAELDPTVLFETIRKVMREKTSLFPEMVLYVLAECARVESLRPEALNAAEEMCTTAEYFLLFFKFAKGLSPHIGTGRACRRFITNWYLKKGSLELAELVGQTPSYKGWRHADLIKIAHIKSSDPAIAAVLTYLSKGVKTMESKYGNEPKAEEVVSYLKNVSNFRRDEDHTSVIRTIETYLLTVHHLNFIHLKNKQVWVALLRRMPVDILLDYIHLLCRYRMFRKGRQWDQDFLTAVFDVLGNPNSVTETRIHPTRVYLDLCTYQQAPKYKLELAAKTRQCLAQKPPALSFELIRNLESLITTSYKNVTPTGLRYLISVDTIDIHKRRCAQRQFMMASQAAAAIVATFYATEKDCIILTNHANVTQFQPKSKEPKIEDIADDFSATEKKVFKGSPKPSWAGVKWAITHEKEVDVFIIIGTSIKLTSIAAMLKELKPQLLVPNFKLVLCSLCSRAPGTKEPLMEEPNVLTVVGFDEKVCDVIARFAKGVF